MTKMRLSAEEETTDEYSSSRSADELSPPPTIYGPTEKTLDANFNNASPELNCTRTERTTFLSRLLSSQRSSEEKDLFDKDVTLDKLVGSGGFGSVYEGRLQNGRRVAVKKMHRTRNNKGARLESFKSELNAIKLQHRNIVRIVASSSLANFDQGAWIIMEFAGECTLQQIMNDSSVSLDLQRRLKYSLDIAQALEYIHDQRIAHLDVKPSNMIVTPQDLCKLGDFGCCKVLEPEIVHGDGNRLASPTQRSFLTGTFAYRAPELLRGEAPTDKADIYSYGITLWQMVTRELPFVGENHHVVIFGVVSYNLRPTLPSVSVTEISTLEQWYMELFIQCWSPKPSDRPASATLADMLRDKTKEIFDENGSHPYLQPTDDEE